MKVTCSISTFVFVELCSPSTTPPSRRPLSTPSYLHTQSTNNGGEWHELTSDDKIRPVGAFLFVKEGWGEVSSQRNFVYALFCCALRCPMRAWIKI